MRWRPAVGRHLSRSPSVTRTWAHAWLTPDPRYLGLTIFTLTYWTLSQVGDNLPGATLGKSHSIQMSPQAPVKRPRQTSAGDGNQTPNIITDKLAKLQQNSPLEAAQYHDITLHLNNITEKLSRTNCPSTSSGCRAMWNLVGISAPRTS
jgi:hypothetical protein